MRQLTKKQKGLLDGWLKKYPDYAGKTFFNISKCDDFPYELLEELEEINNTEILVQEIEHYVTDKEPIEKPTWLR